MKDPNLDLRNQFKSEADQTLFQSIEFTSELRDQIRNKAALETQFHRRRQWKIPLFVSAAAAILCISLISVSYFSMLKQTDTNKIPAPAEPNILIGEDDGITNPMMGPERQSQKLQSPEEAKEVLGEDILLPTYVPEGFVLEQIHANGKNQVIFTYKSGNLSYLMMIEKAENHQAFANFETVQILNTTGYLYETTADAELHLYHQDFYYMIGGHISKDEVMKVAEGLK